MHAEAFAYIATQARKFGPFASVLEMGSRDINGSIRAVLPAPHYVGIDTVDGKGVDVVGDATTWTDPHRFDLVACAEVLEHVPNPEAFFAAAWRQLTAGGRIMFTMATDPRAPHSAADGGPLRGGEYYANVSEEDIKEWLADWDDVTIEVHVGRGDLYVTAVRPA